MDERDEWLEGVRRWYYGGETPAEALPVGSDIAWPGSTTPRQAGEGNERRCTDCMHRRADPATMSMASMAR